MSLESLENRLFLILYYRPLGPYHRIKETSINFMFTFHNSFHKNRLFVCVGWAVLLLMLDPPHQPCCPFTP